MEIETDFKGFPKISRLNREVVITEKIDGTNGHIYITEAREFYVASRNRWITPSDDNHGFATWAYAHQEELMQLGPGRHYGEWWGSGIQRGYGLEKGEKRFSLFNVSKWGASRPGCCHVVPVLWAGLFSLMDIDKIMVDLLISGSPAAPGFRNPEGIVLFHTAAGAMFKKTFEQDEGKTV